MLLILFLIWYSCSQECEQCAYMSYELCNICYNECSDTFINCTEERCSSYSTTSDGGSVCRSTYLVERG